MADLRVHGLGAAVTLRAETPAAEALLPQVEAVWSRCLGGSSDDVDAGHVTIPDPAAEPVDGVLQRLTQSVTHALIEAVAGHLFLFHAASLCHPVSGASVMAVAPGGTGKTTFAAAYGRRYGYLSDETTGVLEGGGIVAYPKPLSIRASSGYKTETSPDALGLLPPAETPRLAAVLLLRRDAGIGSTADVVELPLLDAMAAMTPESSSLSAMTRPLHLLRDLLAPIEPVLQVTYAEVAQLGDLVAELAGPA